MYTCNPSIWNVEPRTTSSRSAPVTQEVPEHFGLHETMAQKWKATHSRIFV